MSDPIFYYDFGSPNAYLAWRVLPQIEARTGRRFVQSPVLLGGVFKATGNQSPISAFRDIPAKLRYEMREIERFVESHSITAFRMNTYFPINTLMLMRGVVAAETLGVGEAYKAAAWQAMWESSQKMDDPQIFGTVLSAAGLPLDRIVTAAQSQTVKQTLIDNTEAAVAAGVFGLPSYSVNGELWFGKDRLRDVEAAMVKY